MYVRLPNYFLCQLLLASRFLGAIGRDMQYRMIHQFAILDSDLLILSLPFIMSEVETALDNLSKGKAAGPDHLCPSTLQNCANASVFYWDKEIAKYFRDKNK